METAKTPKPRVFIDSDVLFAGAASPNDHSASLVILRMAEITLINAITSEQVVVEVERNLSRKIPTALPAFHLLLNHCLRIVPDPSAEEVRCAQKSAELKDLPILLAAAREECSFLTTFNVRHFLPGLPKIAVLPPGELVMRVRYMLSQLQKR